MKHLLIVLFFLASRQFSFSQSYIEDVLLSGSGIGISSNGVDSVYRVTVNVRLSDTLNVDSIYLKIGTSLHGSQLFSASYSAQTENSLSTPQSFVITQFFAYITIGDFLLNQIHFYELELEDIEGNRYSTFIKEM